MKILLSLAYLAMSVTLALGFNMLVPYLRRALLSKFARSQAVGEYRALANQLEASAKTDKEPPK